MLPQLLAAPIKPPPGCVEPPESEITAKEQAIADKEKAIEETMEVYGNTRAGGKKVRELEAEIDVLQIELERARRLYHQRFEPDGLSILHDTYCKSKSLDGRELVECRADLERQLRGIIDCKKSALRKDDGAIDMRFAIALVQSTCGLEGGVILRMPQPRVRGGYRGRPRVPEKPTIDSDRLRPDIIDIFTAENCAAMPSGELIEHVKKLDRPWHIVNFWQLGRALEK